MRRRRRVLLLRRCLEVPNDVREALLRLSRLVEEVPKLGQLDLNPIFALEPGEGYWIADARIEVVPD